MAQQHINLGTAPAGSDGDTNRTAHQKWENNFNELYPGIVGAISGLRLEWLSLTSIRVTTGSAHVPSLGAHLQLSTAITKSGLALSANAWHHVYLYSNGTAADIEISMTAPAAPYSGTARTKTADTSRRYLGSLKTDGTGQIYRFSMDSSGLCRYLADSTVAPFRVLSAGLATSPTAVSVSGIVPNTTRATYLNLSNLDATNVARTSLPTLGTINLIGVPRGSSIPTQVQVDDNMQLSYFYAVASTGGLYIDVLGYWVER